MRRMPRRLFLRPATPRAGFGLPLAALFGALAVCAHGEGAGIRCEDLPEDQRALCEALAQCSSRPSAADRKACFDAAYEELRRVEAPAATSAQAEAAPVAATAEPLVEELVEQPPDIAPEAPPAAREPRAQPERKRDRKWFGWLRRSRAANPKPEPEATPRRFNAVVEAVWQLVRGRQVLLLDDGLLLEGRSGPESRVRAGDTVQVQVAKTLSGEQYRVTAPSRRNFEMARLRCDEEPQHTRKCVAARGKNPKAGW